LVKQRGSRNDRQRLPDHHLIVEYVVIAALIVAVALTALVLFSTQIAAVLSMIGDAIR